MATYLITGSSRGLGLEMVKILLKKPSTEIKTIFATARSPTPSSGLQSLIQSSNNRTVYVPLDVQSDSSISSAVSTITSHLKTTNSPGLDVLINNAGVQIFEQGVSQMHALSETFDINVIGVHKVTAAFLPLLEAGSQKKIANITSTLGSIGMREYSKLAPFPSYKVSKAALNMLSAQYSLELGPKGFTVVPVSPGWNKTDLGGEHADLEPEEGAGAVVDIVMGMTTKDNGCFKDVKVPGRAEWNGKDLYSGEDAPW